MSTITIRLRSGETVTAEAITNEAGTVEYVETGEPAPAEPANDFATQLGVQNATAPMALNDDAALLGSITAVLGRANATVEGSVPTAQNPYNQL